MSEYAVLPLVDYVDACEAAREMTGETERIPSGELAGKIRSISKGENLDAELENQDGLIEDIMEALQGKAADSGDAPVVRPLSVTENGTYTAPDGVDGYNPVVVDVPIPEVPNSVAQATPVITVSASGLITAKATQEGGLVSAGTKSATKQLPTKGATTITPSASEQTAVAAGTYATGDIKVAAVSGGSAGVPVCSVKITFDASTCDVIDFICARHVGGAVNSDNISPDSGDVASNVVCGSVAFIYVTGAGTGRLRLPDSMEILPDSYHYGGYAFLVRMPLEPGSYEIEGYTD